MLKNAILFAVFSLALALVAPQLLVLGLKSQVETARVTSEARSVEAASPIPSASPPVESVQDSPDFRKAVLRADARGHYRADVEVNGRSVSMIVDTGASYVFLSWNTARRLGIVADPFLPRYRVSTANGEIEVSSATVGEIDLQGLSMRDVEAGIFPPEIAAPDLLGTSFLKRLASVEQRDGWMILRQ